MKKTITETFDNDGKVIKRVTVEEEENPIQTLYLGPLTVPFPFISPPRPNPWTDPVYQPWTITCGGTIHTGVSIQ